MEGKGRKGTYEDGRPMKKYLFTWVCVFLLFLNPIMAGAWECEVVVTGPSTIKLDQQVTLSASGTPAGGSYSWSRTPGLIPNGSTATVTGFQPTFSEYIKVVGYYTSPKGKKCSDTKWLWTCLCTLETITGPSQAKVGEEVSLATQGDPAGGIYSWTIGSGTGTLTPNGSSATYVGDRQGTVEIQASYVPPEGGEPCTKYHTIEVGDDCSVSLSGDMYQRPVCRPVNFYAKGQPDPGECSWSPSADFTKDGCNAIYNGTSPGYYTVTATYTRPGGATCKDSKSILSYELVDNMTPNKACYLSGTNLVIDDFNLSTSPPGFQNNALLSPAVVSTINKTQDLHISASLVCAQNPDTVSTVITVVNENVTTGFGIEVEIPNLIKEPLKFLGLADQFDFKMVNAYKQGIKCCPDNAINYTKGETSINAAVDLKGKTLYGIPLPKKMIKYFTLAVKADLKGGTSVSIHGEYKPCENIESWSGGGGLAVKLDIGAKAKANAPQYLVMKCEVKGGTDIRETLEVDKDKIVAKGNWGGIDLVGMVKIKVKRHQIKSFEVKHQLLEGDSTPTFSINLPSLL